MEIQVLKNILNHPLDSGVPIVTHNSEKAHIANTWLSYVELEDDKVLYIPAAGMNITEALLKENNHVILSFTNREIQGKMMPGTGVNVEGTGELLFSGDSFERVQKKFPWARAALKVNINKVTQTL